MLRIVVAPAARRDIAAILAWSEENFGLSAMDRYQSLIGAAIEDLAEDPRRAGSVDRSEIVPACRTYHLRHSRKKAVKRGARVKRPRHFVLFRIREESSLEVARILHDSMDIEEQIVREG